MLIRRANSADLPILKEIYLQTRKKAFYWLNTDNFLIDDFESDTEGELILLAEHDDQIVGFISIWLPDNFIHHLFVTPYMQGEGVGTALIEHAQIICISPMLLKCLTKNELALSFYKSRDWTIVSYGTCDSGEYCLLKSQ